MTGATEEPWTIRRVLTWATADLRERGSPSPRLDAELLLAEVLKVTRVSLITEGEKPLAKHELAAYKSLHVRRRASEPVAYLVGRREFYGRSFAVDARVLVPRPETEALVEVALARTAHLDLAARVLDLCTGSGCVAITLAKERPTTRVVASDVSDAALAVARRNAYRLGAHALAFVRSDLFASFAERDDADEPRRFDLITANPPYIASGELPSLQADVRDFEPHLALDGGADGLDLVRAIARRAPAFLAPGGVLALEVGDDQPEATARILEEAGFGEVEVARDFARRERVVSGRRG